MHDRMGASNLVGNADTLPPEGESREGETRATEGVGGFELKATVGLASTWVGTLEGDAAGVVKVILGDGAAADAEGTTGERAGNFSSGFATPGCIAGDGIFGTKTDVVGAANVGNLGVAEMGDIVGAIAGTFDGSGANGVVVEAVLGIGIPNFVVEMFDGVADGCVGGEEEEMWLEKPANFGAVVFAEGADSVERSGVCSS